MCSSFFGLAHANSIIIFLGLGSAIIWQSLFCMNKTRGWWKSSLITALSIFLLMKAYNPTYYFIAIFLAVSSKFFFRDRDGNHFLNPSNMAIVLLLLFTDQVWIDYGHWGRDLLMLVLPVSLFFLVGREKKVYQVAFLFLGQFFILAMFRNIYIGDPWTVFTHQYLNVSMFVFAFFMISDPRTTPNSFKGKLIFTSVVALFAIVWDGFLYNRNGLLLGLFFTSLMTPIINKKYSGEIYQWKTQRI